MDLNEMRTDANLEEEGVWQPAGGEAKLLIARFGNPKSERLFQKMTRPYRRQIDQGTMPPEKQREIVCRVLAEAVLLDWSGLTLDGEPVEYSTERAFDLLMEFRELREMVEDYAKDAEAYRQEEIEAAAGN